MSRNPFGWSLPPGVTQKMIDDQVQDDEPEQEADTCYIIEGEDFDKLYKMVDFIGSGQRLNNNQRRDLRHKMWLILDRVRKNRYEG